MNINGESKEPILDSKSNAKTASLDNISELIDFEQKWIVLKDDLENFIKNSDSSRQSNTRTRGSGIQIRGTRRGCDKRIDSECDQKSQR